MMLTIVFIVFAAFLFFKLPVFSGGTQRAQSRALLKRKPRTSTQGETPHHAVSIECGLDACPSVQSIANNYFLAKDAPHLPLQECSAESCQCRYAHHKGRRHSLRRNQSALSTESYSSKGKVERREQRGRRATD